MLTEKHVATVPPGYAQLGLRLTNVGDLAKDLRPGRVTALKGEEISLMRRGKTRSRPAHGSSLLAAACAIHAATFSGWICTKSLSSHF